LNQHRRLRGSATPFDDLDSGEPSPTGEAAGLEPLSAHFMHLLNHWRLTIAIIGPMGTNLIQIGKGFHHRFTVYTRLSNSVNSSFR